MRKREWLLVVKGRKSSLFRSYALPVGVCENMKSILGRKLMSYPVLVKEKKTEVYLDREEVGNLSNLILLRLKRDPKFAQRHFLEFNKRARELIRCCYEVPKLNLKQLNQSDLLKIFIKYTDNYQKLVPFMTTPHLFQVALENKIKEYLSKRGFGEDEFFDLAIPIRQTFETVYQKDLLRLSTLVDGNLKFKKLFLKPETSKIVKELPILKQYREKWSWIALDDYPYEINKEEDLIKAIKGNLNLNKKPNEFLKEIEKNQREIYRNAQILIRRLKPNKEEQALINLLQKYIWLRTSRLETFRKAFLYTKPLLLEIARRAGFLGNEIYYLTPPEIVVFLKENKLPDKRLLKKRTKGYVMAAIDGKYKLYSGKNWVEKFETEMDLKRKESSKIIKGRVACLGKVEGKVKLILSKEEISKIEKGDILVTTMTSPDYVIAMQKAAAIVTDEGGITCHAAIVSRELGVPCIVGTGNATQVLKDDDIVEVDAINGIVRLTKSYN